MVGKVACTTLVLWPSVSHNSSQICGAKEDNAITNGSRIARLLHFSSINSLVAIMNWLTQVLNEKRSISSFTFFSVRFITLSSASFGVSSLRFSNRRQKRFKNPCTPVMPFVFQGLDCSSGP